MARIAGVTGKETADRIRRAATELFALRGFAAVSMRDIAGEVGIGPGALYNHFATKQDLLSELMEDHLKALLAAWRDRKPSEGETHADALEAFVRFHMQFHRDRSDDVFVAYMELRSLEQPNFFRIERMRSAYETELETIIADGATHGVFHAPEPKIAAMALIAMITGVTNWYRQGGRLSPQAIENLYVDMALNALRPQHGPEMGDA